MTQTPTLSLNDGRNIPQLGFGTYQIDNDDAAEAVSTVSTSIVVVFQSTPLSASSSPPSTSRDRYVIARILW